MPSLSHISHIFDHPNFVSESGHGGLDVTAPFTVGTGRRARLTTFFEPPLKSKPDGCFLQTSVAKRWRASAFAANDTAFASRRPRRPKKRKPKITESAPPVKKNSKITELPTSKLFFYRIALGGGLAAAGQACTMVSGKDGVRDDDGLSEFPGTLSERVTESSHGEEDFLVVGNQLALYNPMAGRNFFRGIPYSLLGWSPVWKSLFGQLCVTLLSALITLESIHLLDPILGGIFDDVFRNDNATDRLGEFAAKTQVFTSFFLGLWNTMTLARRATLWKTGVQGIIKATSKLSLSLSTRLPERWFVQDVSGPQEVLRSDVQSAIRRWSLASLDLVFRTYGWEQRIDAALSQMEGEGTLTPKECRALVRVSDPVTGIWGWHSRMLSDLTDQDVLSKFDLKMAHDAAQQGLNSVVYIQQELRNQVPFSYVNFVSVMVNTSVYGAGAVGGVFIGKALLRTNEVQAFTELAICCVTALVSFTALELSLNSANPFTNTCDSFCRGSAMMDFDDTVRSLEITAEERPLLLRD